MSSLAFRRPAAIASALVCLLAGAQLAHGATYAVRVRWSPSATASVAGYRIAVRTLGGAALPVVDAGLPAAAADGSLSGQVAGLDGRTDYRVAVRAYAADGTESVESNTIDIGYTRVAARIDSDGDGLTDAEEDRNLNRVVDAGETDPLAADTDGDGIGDAADRCPGTAPGGGVGASGCSCAQVTCNDGVACTTDTCSNGTCAATSTCGGGTTCNLATGACDATPAGGATSIWPSTAAPVRASRGADNPAELGVKFRSDVAGYVTGIRFYKHVSNTGAHVGSLWSSTGTRLANATFTGETASGWQQVSFAQPVAIAANTVYVASYHCPNGHFSFDVNYFASQGVDRPPLRALANGVAGPNGVFAYGPSGSFPNQTYAATNYWVDVVFSPTAPAPVTITTASLPSGTAGIAYTATLAASGGTPPYTWAIASGALPAGLALNAASGVVSGTPAAAGTSSFTVRATSGTQSATRTFSITIAAPSPPPSQALTIWPDTATPGVADGGPDSAVELGVKFRSAVAGWVTGVRFYKHARNTGSHVGNLWTAAGARLATATFTAESASGWQQVTFSPPVAIAANTVYVASYHCPNGHYSEDVSYFATAGVDRPPLRALANGEAGPNSVYAYGTTSRFPTQTWKAANYWVDVVFTTSAPGVTAALRLSPDGAPGASVGWKRRAGGGRAAVRRFAIVRDRAGDRLEAVGRFPFPADVDLATGGMTLVVENEAGETVLGADLPGAALDVVRGGWRARASATALERLVVRRRSAGARVILRARLPESGAAAASATLRWRVRFGAAPASEIVLDCRHDGRGRQRCRAQPADAGAP